MKKLKTGTQLWETIQEAARKKFKLEEDCVLTMFDFGHPVERVIGECFVGLHKLTDTKFICQGHVTYDPYVHPSNNTES